MWLNSFVLKTIRQKNKIIKIIIQKCLPCGLKGDDLLRFNNVGTRITFAVIIYNYLKYIIKPHIRKFKLWINNDDTMKMAIRTIKYFQKMPPKKFCKDSRIRMKSWSFSKTIWSIQKLSTKVVFKIKKNILIILVDRPYSPNFMFAVVFLIS